MVNIIDILSNFFSNKGFIFGPNFPISIAIRKKREPLAKNEIIIKENDLVVIRDVGAYGMSLASNYNVRPLPAEILVKSSNAQIIRSRQKLTDLV